jgi:excisionase family DNA binding protein
MDNTVVTRFGVGMSNTELLTAQQVADRLSVHVESVRRWTRRGDLAAVRLPSGRYRYRSEDVAALVQNTAA